MRQRRRVVEKRAVKARSWADLDHCWTAIIRRISLQRKTETEHAGDGDCAANQGTDGGFFVFEALRERNDREGRERDDRQDNSGRGIGEGELHAADADRWS